MCVKKLLIKTHKHYIEIFFPPNGRHCLVQALTQHQESLIFLSTLLLQISPKSEDVFCVVEDVFGVVEDVCGVVEDVFGW